MQTPNRDLFNTDATQDHYKGIAPLIVSPLLDGAFRAHDRAANLAKKRYHRLGQLAIVLVAMSAIFTIAEALVLPQVFQNVALTYVAVTMAGIGLFLQIYLITTKQKQKWLVNRFASERIRSLKFQAYLFTQDAADINILDSLTQVFTREKLAKLENELNMGIAVLRNFSPSKIIDSLPAAKPSQNTALSDLAFEAYDELRVQYQRNFALAEVAAFTGRRRIFNSTQDMIYLGAAVFAFLSLGAKIGGSLGWAIDTGWIDFIAVTLFVMGASEAIMDNALLEEQSQTRYEQYARDIDEAAARHSAKGGTFSDLVLDMEQICLNELDLFCRAAERISYRF